MQKKFLILSDNSNICKRVAEVNSLLKIEHLFDFATSKHSDINGFDWLSYPIKVINLKNDDDIAYITNNYSKVFSIHSKQIFPKTLLCKLKCFNLHPGYNPINRGWYPQVFAIIYDTPVGATFHEIDEELDNGNIIDRSFVEKYSFDTSYTLYKRIVDMEIKLWARNIINVLSDSYKAFAPESKGNLYLKRDFNKLTQLDLKSEMKLSDAINLLRALTFDGYDNAYFIDENGNKVFINITLKLENNE